MGIGVDCSSTKTIQMVCLVFLLYGYQYRFIVRNTVHQVSARRAFSNVNPAFMPANRCFKQVLWDCCHVLVNPTTTIHGTFQQAWQVQQYFVLCFSVCKCFFRLILYVTVWNGCCSFKIGQRELQCMQLLMGKPSFSFRFSFCSLGFRFFIDRLSFSASAMRLSQSHIKYTPVQY